jgi:hypothetical protein
MMLCFDVETSFRDYFASINEASNERCKNTLENCEESKAPDAASASQ